MAIVIQVLAALLTLTGLAGLIYGIDLLPTERGMAATIASTTAVVGGVITVALGVIVQRLDRLAKRLSPAKGHKVKPAAAASAGAPAKPSGRAVLPLPAAPLPGLAGDPLTDLPQPEPPRRAGPDMQSEAAPTPATVRPTVAFDPPVPVTMVPVPTAETPSMPEPPVPAARLEPAPLAPKKERSKFRLPKFGKAAVAVSAASTAVAGVAAMTVADGSKGEATLPGDAPEGAAGDAALPADLATSKPIAPADAAATAQDLPPSAEEDSGDTRTHVPEPLAERIADDRPPLPAALPPDPMAELEAELDRLIPLHPARPVPKLAAVPPPAEVASPPVEILLPPIEAEDTLPATDVQPTETAAATYGSVVAEVVDIEGAAAEKMPARSAPDLPSGVLAGSDDFADEPPVTPPPGADVIGSYESGGASYTMYSDGSVIVEMDSRTLRFASLEALRDFIDSGGKT